VNQIVQDDGYVLSEDENRLIMDRIDRYNSIIREAVRRREECFHLIDIGEYLNDVLGGKSKISAGQFKLRRKWGRGNSLIDPYVDRDGDGWFPGPDYPPQGLTEVLFYFKDPDDDDPMLQPQIQPNIWHSITRALMYRIITGELY
jgi:hypothetical protein